MVELGRVVSAYGVQGWVKIQPFSPQADVLRNAKQWWLARPVLSEGQGVSSSAVAVSVRRVRSQGSDLVAQIADVNDRDQAEALKGHVISVSRSLFPKAEEDEVYWIDLIGCALFGVDAQGESILIGTVSEVLDNGAHGVLKVGLQRQDASGEWVVVTDAKGRPVDTLVPYVAAHIQAVDLVARRITSDWPADF